jgi:hypothetical protein
MDQPLINLSPDLFRLQQEGFELEIKEGYLLVHKIPYVNPKAEIRFGTLLFALTLATTTRTGQPPDHTAWFIGEIPSLSDGRPYTAITNHSNRTKLTETIWGDHYFSSKPPGNLYPDYYQKVWTYAEILCAQAHMIDPSVTYKPNKKKEESIHV